MVVSATGGIKLRHECVLAAARSKRVAGGRKTRTSLRIPDNENIPSLQRDAGRCVVLSSANEGRELYSTGGVQLRYKSVVCSAGESVGDPGKLLDPDSPATKTVSVAVDCNRQALVIRRSTEVSAEAQSSAAAASTARHLLHHRRLRSLDHCRRQP